MPVSILLVTSVLLNQESLPAILMALVILTAGALIWRHWHARLLLAERNRNLVRCANDMVLVLDQNGRIVEASDQAVAGYGYSRDELLERCIWHLFRNQASWQEEDIARRVEDERGLLAECVHRRKDGSSFPVDVNAQRIGGGSRYQYQLVARDITERKRAAAEAERQNRELEAALETAREASELKSQFLANMSHEIRTPIHGVLGMTELLLCTHLDGEQREYADSVRRSAQSLLTVVNDILDLSKIEAGKLELESVVFDLWSTVEEVAALVAFSAYAKNLELTCLLEAGIPRLVRGDPARLRQILTNLAGNAVKFTERGEVRIHAGVTAENGNLATLRFTVADTGIGIPPEQRGRLFQTFSQGDRAITRRYGGTGLGLSISRHLAELMQGSIGFESEAGRGSTFWFTAVVERQPTEPVADQPLAGLRLAVVGERNASRSVVCRYLHSWGCRADEVPSAGEALGLLRKAAAAGEPVRLAVIDLDGMDPDGYTLAREIRNDAEARDTALIALVPAGGIADGVELRNAGFAAHLSKPVRQSQLYGRLLEVLAGPAAAGEGVAAGAYPASRRNRRVLLAEDNDINQKIVLRLLSRAGYEAERVSNGREAVEAAAAGHYDLILMDVQMPEMDGFAATAEIRRLEAGIRHTPIAAMTANAMSGDRDRCLAAGMDDYISKPVRLEELGRLVERWAG